jgi:hypothetical protein
MQQLDQRTVDRILLAIEFGVGDVAAPSVLFMKPAEDLSVVHRHKRRVATSTVSQ